jgi:hypothetical protein
LEKVTVEEIQSTLLPMLDAERVAPQALEMWAIGSEVIHG